MNRNDFRIVIPSCDKQHSDDVYNHIINSGIDSKLVIKKDGTGYPSFSKLINDSILATDTEVVIICSDRCKPTHEQVERTLNLLDEGFGFVGLWRFAFFGFRKQLIQRVGFLDENYVGGGYEDTGFVLRLKEADIAYYEKEEIDYRASGSRWAIRENHGYHNKKWFVDEHCVKRLSSESMHNYDLGEWPDVTFLNWNHSLLLDRSRNLIHKTFIGEEK